MPGMEPHEELVEAESATMGTPCTLIEGHDFPDGVQVITYRMANEAPRVSGRRLQQTRVAVFVDGESRTSLIAATEWVA